VAGTALAGCEKTAPKAAMRRCTALANAHISEYAALVESPRALLGDLIFAFQQPAKSILNSGILKLSGK